MQNVHYFEAEPAANSSIELHACLTYTREDRRQRCHNNTLTWRNVCKIWTWKTEDAGLSTRLKNRVNHYSKIRDIHMWMSNSSLLITKQAMWNERFTKRLVRENDALADARKLGSLSPFWDSNPTVPQTPWVGESAKFRSYNNQSACRHLWETTSILRVSNGGWG